MLHLFLTLLFLGMAPLALGLGIFLVLFVVGLLSER